MEDFTLKDFEDAMAYQDELNRERTRQYKKEEEEEKQHKKGILELKHVHAKVDALVGLYPMTKDMLLERIELINNGWFHFDVRGMQWPMKPMIIMCAEFLEENDLEKIYEFYLTEVKPYISGK